jgi:predicted permease
VGAIYRDIRQGIRLLARNPLFTVVAALSLGLGIGANSALFSMFNSLLWRPLPVEAPDRLVSIYSRTSNGPYYDAFPYVEYQDYAAEKTFDGLASYGLVECAVGQIGQDASRIYGEAVSGNFFQVVRPRLALGRGIRPEEAASMGRDPVVVLSHRIWQRRYQADPGIVGRSVVLSGQPFTVVGVAAPEFHGVYSVYFGSDLWVPISMMPRLATGYDVALASRDNREFRMIGRLRPGGTVEQAQAAVRTIAGRLATAYPQSNRDVTAHVFRELDTRPEVEIAGDSNRLAWIFMSLTALVLLIACANVANLLLARSSTRRKEIAMRAALGASRGQIVRQLLVESVLLALLAGGVGLLAGSMAAQYVGSIQVPTDIPIVFDFQTDARVVLFTLGISLLAGIAFGLLPALRVSRGDLVPALKSSAAHDPSHRRFTLANVLVVGQVAASLVLLIVAGLCARSIGGARTIDPGFRTDNRVIMSFSPSLLGYDDERARQFYRVLLARVRHLPSIQAATIARWVPLDFSSSGGDVIVEGRTGRKGNSKEQTLASTVDSEYFRTMGTPLRQGRAFTEHDTASSLPVAIVNEQFARQFWPGQNPIGKRVQYDIPNGPFMQVVGVAADGKYRQLAERPTPYLFVPYDQRPRPRVSMVVHYRGDLHTTLAAVRREVQSIDPNMPIFDTKTMDQFMERSMLGPRLSATVAGPAGLLAGIIAALGLYGVMAYSVSRRTQEVGIRVAIGASPQDILRLVMRQGFVLSGIGVGLGLAVSVVAGRLIAFMLFGISPTDPVVFLGVPALLVVVAAVACYVPARRALSVDPLTALRQE